MSRILRAKCLLSGPQRLKRYRKLGDISEGALFRRIRRGDHIHNERLTAHSARRIIKKRAAAAGVEGFISGHSLRVGSAVSLAKAGLRWWICKSRAGGSRHRCLRIMRRRSLLSGARLHGSRTASDSPSAKACGCLDFPFLWGVGLRCLIVLPPVFLKPPEMPPEMPTETSPLSARK